MLRNIVAVEREGWDLRTLTIIFEVPNEAFDGILSDLEVNWDEELVDESQFEEDEDEKS